MARSDFAMLPCGTPGVAAVVARSRHSFDRHTHEAFGIGTIIAGAQRWRSGGRQAEAGPGVTIAVNPGEVHDGAPVGDERQWLMLYLEPSVLLAAAEDISGRDERDFEIAQPVLRDPRAAATLKAFFVAETRGAETCRREELLLALAERVGPFVGRRLRPPTAAVTLARSRIDDDPASPVTLAELAMLGGICRFQLLRGFARTTGLTPHAYVVQKRVDLARKLIAGGLSLAQAAATAGFSDQSHMTRLFVRKYGVTPGAFLKASN